MTSEEIRTNIQLFQTLRPQIVHQTKAGRELAVTEDEGPTFKCFKKLPLELRIMIWKLAEPERM
jgi:hypothetical protein